MAKTSDGNRVGLGGPAARRARAAVARRLIWLVAIAAAVGAGAYYRSRPVRVEVTVPRAEAVTESISATGRVEGVQETDVFSAVPGRVRRLLVAEGDRVEAGTPLAILDNTVDSAGVDSARAALATAQAQLKQASAPTRRTELARTKAEAEQAERVASARLAAAEHKLADLVRGATPEQIEAAAAALASAEYRARAAGSAVTQARARLEQAKRDLERQTTLVADGAVSQSDADRAQTARDEAEAAVKSAEETLGAAQNAQREAAARLAELRAGTPKETLDLARAEVAAARATLQGAKRVGAAQVETAVIGPRDVDIAVARTRVAEAQRALDLTLARLAETVVRSPAAGLVSKVLAYPGASLAPSAPLLRLVPANPLEVVVDVDENYLGKLRPGLETVVTSDAFPGERANGRVMRVGAQVDRDRGSIEVRVLPSGAVGWLRPGQTVSVNIIVMAERTMLTVPLTAVTTDFGGATGASPSQGAQSALVFVVERGVVRARNVRTGAPGAQRIPILDGIDEGGRVVVNASAVKAGQRVEEVLKAEGRRMKDEGRKDEG